MRLRAMEGKIVRVLLQNFLTVMNFWSSIICTAEPEATKLLKKSSTITG